MGFNTFNSDNDCYVEGWNESNQTFFKYKEVSPMTLARKSIASNLKLEGASLVIEIDGLFDIKLNDRLKLNDRIYKVLSMASTYNTFQRIHRIDYDHIEGETLISLE